MAEERGEEEAVMEGERGEDEVREEGVRVGGGERVGSWRKSRMRTRGSRNGKGGREREDGGQRARGWVGRWK